MGKITIKVLSRYVVCCIFILHSVQCLANEKDAIATVKSFAQILSEYNISKDLDMNKELLKQIISNEIVTAYYYISGSIENGLKHDKIIKEACNIINNPDKYREILNVSKKKQ